MINVLILIILVVALIGILGTNDIDSYGNNRL